MPDVTITVDGKKISAPAGTLLIEACKNAGIEVPAFCYYPGLSLQAACRMCVVRIEKMPKLQPACTGQVAEAMAITTESDEVTQARDATIEPHCGDGCKTTLGVRRADTGMEIVRGDNRDKSGINGDFLCIKGRYAFDFANHSDRITKPLLRQGGKLTPVSWEQAIDHVAN